MSLSKKYYYPEGRIAIVGMGGIFPDADNIEQFWSNILDKKVSIRELPDSVLNSKIYYRANTFKQIDKHDKTYTRMGSMVNYEAVMAAGKKFRIPPAVAEHMDQNQHAAIYCVDQALQGLKGKKPPEERTAIILGNGNPGAHYERAIERIFYATIEELLSANPLLQSEIDKTKLDKILKEISATALEKSLPLTEDTAPGILQNLVAGRIANVFGFQGPSFMTDAACASSLVAMITGIQGLLRNEYDTVISGGIDLGLQSMYFAAFSAINALSPDGSFPFDTRANGFIIGQGGGVIIMKRLEDALRDNDEIIALISGYGQGSDGKGKYIAAPNEDGQARVIEKACKMAGYSVDTIELIEAHGTGTAVGDVVEVNGLKKAFAAMSVSRLNYCGIGTVKSNIGHLKAAAGAPGIIKASLALYNKTLPPTAGLQQINPKLQLENSPFYILNEKKSWPETSEHPRRANVSAFGFGGADYHITLEEFRPEFYRKIYALSSSEENRSIGKNEFSQKSGGIPILFSGESLDAIIQSYHDFLGAELNQINFNQTAFFHNAKISANQKMRLAICAVSPEELIQKWNIFQEYLATCTTKKTDTFIKDGIYFSQNPAVTSQQIAILFPGQASQYANMGKELPGYFPMLQSFYTQADALWQAKYGYPITSLLFGEDEAYLEQELKNTKNTHPAMFLTCAALYKLLSESGIKADYLVGHSLGEITALFAGGMLDLPPALQVIGARGFSFDCIPNERRGKMLSIKARREVVEEVISESGSKIYITNLNSPEQTVVGGTEQMIDSLVIFLSKKKIVHTILNVSHAFHTPLMLEAAEDFYNKIAGIKFNIPNTKIVINHLQKFYPQSPSSLKNTTDILKDQITAAVKFSDSIELLYQKGVRVFVEVGPSTVLSNLVKQILAGKEIKVIATNQKRKDAVEVYYQSLAELFALGVDIQMVPPQNCCPTNYIGNSISLTVGSETAGIVEQKSARHHRESLVYSGVSIGLPGSFKKVFDEENFDLLCEGRNFIETLSDRDLNYMLDLNITRLIKNEESSMFKRLSSFEDLIHLSGRLGKLDMSEDYLLDERILKQMTTTICAGVAAGYEALRDAGIPLVQEWVSSSSGKKLPGRLLLPEEMRDNTGIVYASCFTKIEPFIREVSQYIAVKYGSKTKQELIEFYETLILQVKDPETKKILTDWFAAHYSSLNESGNQKIYEFNNDFMAQFSSLANNRLAQLIGASGPNLQLSAACSSTAYAVTVSESLILAGQAERMIVIGAENPSSELLLPWIGGGFLTSGAATNKANIYEAAVPFDNRRNGMIIGAGAVGIVIEKETAVEARGMKGICRLLGTHSFNLAGHQTRIDSRKFSAELERFIAKMEQEYRIDRKNIAPKTLYFSHETYTPKKGGCSQTEKIALETVFGDQFREILVTNTKGMTGHTIGASIEEAVAAKSLQYQKVPPVVNYKKPDPELEGLKLAKGGAHSFEYALRMIAGFGGQGNYILMQKLASGDDRIFDKPLYQSWLTRIGDSAGNELGVEGRILVLKGQEKLQREKTQVSPGTIVTDQILEIFSNVTKYPVEMLDFNMEMEADLGIDTVKQATIFGLIAERFQLEQSAEIQFSNYPTIGDIVNLVAAKTGHRKHFSENQTEIAASTALADVFTPIDNEEKVMSDVLKIISQVTKYPMDMLEPDMELEADLGIDTVKQATILSYIADKYQGPSDEPPQISSLPTIRDIVNMIRNQAENNSPKIGLSENTPELPRNGLFQEKTVIEEAKPDILPLTPEKDGGAESMVFEIIAAVTKYPVDMLEPEMEMEADLGIDTVKQATIFSILGERFGMENDRTLNISEYKTIGAVIEFVKSFTVQNIERDENLEAETNQDSNSQALKENSQLQNGLCYQVPVAVKVKLPAKDFSLKGKNLWIIGNQESTVQKIAAFFTGEAKNIGTFVFTSPSVPEKTAAWINEFSNSPVDVLIDCGDLAWPLQVSVLSPKAEKQLLYLNSEARFLFYKELFSKFPDRSLRIVCLVSMGEPGSTNKNRIIDPYSGALSGFYKGLRKEWRQSIIKIVDPDIAEDWEQQLPSGLIGEIQTGGEDYEIVYSGNTRKAIKLNDFEQTDFKPQKLPKQPHFLITGGANGITAEIAIGLAEEIGDGAFTLIGRTVLPENISELAKMTEDQLTRERTAIINRLKLTEPKVTPIMVQHEYEKLIKAISAYKVLEKIRKTGSKVLYFACDVRKEKELQSVINTAVKKQGAIYGLIHGAGIEKSHLLSDKSIAEFQEVFSTKAIGICNLIRAVNLEELKVLIGFSSISGRFGNEAQLDYCAANSFLSSFLRKLKTDYPGLHVVSIDWSGWKELGMAWRNEFVKNHSEEMGINLIEPARGVKAMIQVLTHKFNQDEIIISKGLKGFIDNHLLLNNINETPLIGWTTFKNRKIETAYKIISIKQDPIFDHHRLGTTPLVPAVAMMEICAEFHRLRFGLRKHYCFRGLSVLNPLKLFHEQSQEVFVETKSELEPDTLELTFNSYFKPKIGVPKLICYCQVQVNDQPGDFEKLLKNNNIAEHKKLTEVSWEEFNSNPKWQFNNNIALGPLFIDDYGYKNNMIAYNENSLIYTYTVSKEQLDNKKYQLEKLLLNPCLMDTIFQAAAMHALTQHDRIHLPMYAEEIGVIRVPRQIEKLKIVARLTHYGNDCGNYDIIILGEPGDICYYAKNVNVQRINL